MNSEIVDQHVCDLLSINITEFEFIDPGSTTIAGDHTFSFYVSGPLLTFFIVIGLLGNSFCLYVFKPCRRANTGGTPPIYVYLFGLAMWDFVLLLASLLLYNLPELTRGSILTNPNYVFTRPYIYCATNAAHTSSNWVVVALGLERYFALCHPFRHRLLNDGRRRAVYAVTGISIAGVLYSLPRLFEVLSEFSSVPECVTNEDGTYEMLPGSASHDSVRQSFLYRTLYKIVGGTILYSVGPFVCLLIVSIRVSAAIRQQRYFQNSQRYFANNQIGQQTFRSDHQNNNNNNNSRDSCSYSINIMLVSVVVKLLFVHALPTGLDVAETTMGDEKFSNDQTIEYLINFLTLLLAVNSSCNFFIYYTCSRRFRNELPQICFNRRGGFQPLYGMWNFGGPCCRSRYQEASITTTLTSTIIVNESCVGRIVNADHV